MFSLYNSSQGYILLTLYERSKKVTLDILQGIKYLTKLIFRTTTRTVMMSDLTYLVLVVFKRASTLQNKLIRCRINGFLLIVVFVIKQKNDYTLY